MTSIAPREPVVPTEQMKALLAAHADWLARGRTGEGRLVLSGVSVDCSLADTDLRGAEFDASRFVGTSFVRARLDGARVLRSSFERADLRHASLAECRFEDTDLRRAMVAGATLARTGFLRCAFGDFGSQPIGKPDVKSAYAVVAPDVSHAGDGSRIGSPAEVDARWFTAPADGSTRRFAFDAGDGSRFVALVLNMYVTWSREVGPRFQDRVAHQSFGQFLADGAPAPWRESLPDNVGQQLRDTVSALANAALPPDASGTS